MSEELRKILQKNIDGDLSFYKGIILKAYDEGIIIVPFFDFVGKDMYRNLVRTDIFETPKAQTIKGRHIFAYTVKSTISNFISYIKSSPHYTPHNISGYFICELSEKGKNIAKLDSERIM